MAINFPDSPAENDSFTSGGKKWIFNGTVWTLITANSYTIPTGEVTTAKILDANVTAAKLASGAAVANIGYTPANVASPTFTGTVVLPSTTSIGTVTSTEIGYVDGVTSAIQAQLDSKLTATTDVTSNRNVVINGAMQVAQRGTSTAGVTDTLNHGVDRFQSNIATLGTWTVSQESDAPTGSGFRKSLKYLVTTADASPAAGDFAAVLHKMEGQNVQQFLKGTASAKSFSLSMWVKSGTTGTYIAELIDNDNSRYCSQSYTISVVDTWEKKTLVFPADTTGVLDNDNAISLSFNFYFAAGSTRNSGTLQTVWGTSQTGRATGQVNLAAAAVALTNYWQVTGVQLEVGSVATPFEFEDISVTLNKCFRYYQRFVDPAAVGVSTGSFVARTLFPLYTKMRATPTTTLSGTLNFYNGSVTASTSTLSNVFNSVSQGQLDLQVAIGSIGQAISVYTNYGSQYVDFSAEL